MTASAFLDSWAISDSLSCITIGFLAEETGSFIRDIPLRSPMSIFSKSPDLEKCEAGARE